MPPLTPPKSAADLAAYVADGQLLTARPGLPAPGPEDPSPKFTPGTAYPVHTRERTAGVTAAGDAACPGNLHVTIRVVRVLEITDDRGATNTFGPAPRCRPFTELWRLFTPPPLPTIAETHHAEFKRNLARLLKLAQTVQA